MKKNWNSKFIMRLIIRFLIFKATPLNPPLKGGDRMHLQIKNGVYNLLKTVLMPPPLRGERGGWQLHHPIRDDIVLI
jgi:hypothetical protein